jgi:hypothetical protein
MPDPREGGDTWGIDLVSLLLGGGILFYLTSRKLPRVGRFDILVTSLLSFSQISFHNIKACFRKIAR